MNNLQCGYPDCDRPAATAQPFTLDEALAQKRAEYAAPVQPHTLSFEDWWAGSGFTKFKDTAQAAWDAAVSAAAPVQQEPGDSDK